MTAARFDRADGARLLRAARRGDADAIELAAAALPECRAARRLLVAHLMANGDDDRAWAILSRDRGGRRPDPALALARARLHRRRGRLLDARFALTDALARRPDHVATRLEAARVERALGEPDRALAHLRRIAARRPNDARAATRLVECLLELGSTAEAERALARHPAPGPRLQARIEAARGRRGDAAERLEIALAAALGASDDRRAARTRAALIDLQAETGGWADLAPLLAEAPIGPEDEVAAARAWLALGHFDLAARAALRLRRTPRARRDALAVLHVAAVFLDRHGLARRALARLQGVDGGADPERIADLWRRAAAARLMLDQGRPRSAGADRNGGFLAGIAAEALAALEGAEPLSGRRLLRAAAPGDPRIALRRALAA